VHFTPLPSDTAKTGGKRKTGNKRRKKLDIVTRNLFRGKPDKLTKAEAAEVETNMSSDVECMCRQLQHTLTTDA
jgi:hypothetical protein